MKNLTSSYSKSKLFVKFLMRLNLSTYNSVLVFLVMSLSLASCSSNKAESFDENSDENIEVDAKSLYVLHCESCHGLDGKKGTSGAADLSKSKFTDKEIINVIENGNDKGMMPYKDLIASKKERNSLMEFVKTLRK